MEVSVRIAEVGSPRSGLEELSGEQAGITKAKVQSFAHGVFKSEIEFIANVAARAGMGGNGNGSTAGVEIVICGDKPVAYKCLFEFPFFGGFLFHAGSELHQVPAPNLIGETELVVVGRIELVEGIPVTARRIFRAGSVVALDKYPRCGSHIAE